MEKFYRFVEDAEDYPLGLPPVNLMALKCN
jgi:hypothetical protein